MSSNSSTKSIMLTTKDGGNWATFNLEFTDKARGESDVTQACAFMTDGSFPQMLAYRGNPIGSSKKEDDMLYVQYAAMTQLKRRPRNAEGVAIAATPGAAVSEDQGFYVHKSIYPEVLKMSSFWERACSTLCGKLNLSLDEDLRRKMGEDKEYAAAFKAGQVRIMWLELEASNSLTAGSIVEGEKNVLQMAFAKEAYAAIKHQGSESLTSLLARLQDQQRVMINLGVDPDVEGYEWATSLFLKLSPEYQVDIREADTRKTFATIKTWDQAKALVQKWEESHNRLDTIFGDTTAINKVTTTGGGGGGGSGHGNGNGRSKKKRKAAAKAKSAKTDRKKQAAEERAKQQAGSNPLNNTNGGSGGSQDKKKQCNFCLGSTNHWTGDCLSLTEAQRKAWNNNRAARKAEQAK
jgi:hypothetical protein